MRHKRGQRKLIPIKQALYIVLSFGFLAASAMMFFVEPELSRPFFARPFNIYRISIMVLALVFLLLATKSNWLSAKPDTVETPKASKWLKRLSYALPILAIICLITQLACPEFATLLVRKETWPFYRNAIFIKVALQLIGLVAFGRIAYKYARQRNWLAMILATLVAIVLFIMAGEELSWGQRIFGWATPDSLSGLNEQGEMNLHNLATQAFQNTLYFGGWLLLIGFAFWNKSLAGIVAKARTLRFLTDWLPPTIFVLAFAPAFGFGDPLHSETGLYYGSNLFVVIGTLIALIALCVKYVYNHNDKLLRQSLLTLVAFLIIAIGGFGFSQVWNINSGAATEYLEVFISVGLMSWALLVNSRIKLSQPAQKNNQ